MSGGVRDRIFGGVAKLGTSRPWRVLIVALVLLVALGVSSIGLDVSTSRTGLVSDDDPQQKRMNAFFERFGRPDVPLFVVSGGDAAARRTLVDRLQEKLESEPDLRGRVLGRIGPEDVASVALLAQPELLGAMRGALGRDADVSKLLESGVAGWLNALAERILAGLDGDDDDDGPAGSSEQEAEQAVAQLAQLGTLAAVLEDVLVGRDPLDRFAGQTSFGQRGVDDKGYLVTTDAEHHLVVVYAEFSSDEGRVLRPIIERFRELRDEALVGAPEGLEAHLTGLPALSVDELEIVQAGLISSSIAATLGIFGLCLALFRSFRQTVVALLPLLPGIVATLAAVHLLYGHLNLITSSFVAVLLGLGIDFSVHLVSRRNEEIRKGASEASAILLALQRTGPGIATGAIVTAAAFLTNATTEFTAYGELGIVTAIGLLAIMAITLVLIPPLLVVGRGSAQPKLPPEPPGIGVLLVLVRRAKLPLVVLGVLGAVAGAATLQRIDFNARYFDFLPQSTESAKGLAVLEYDELASPVFAAITAESVEEARTKAERLRALPNVAGVQTPSDLLPPLDDSKLAALRSGLSGSEPNFAKLAALELSGVQLAKASGAVASALEDVKFELKAAGQSTESVTSALTAFRSLTKTAAGLDEVGKARVAALHAGVVAIAEPAWRTASAVAARGHYTAQDLPPLFAERFVAEDGEGLAIYAVPAGSFWEVEVADAFAADVRSVDEDAVGLAMVHVEHGQMVLAGFRKAAIFAAGVIVVLLLIDFRSLRGALLALLPTALGWCWMMGLMPLLGLSFNVANIVALPLVLGIGITFGVHMVHRQREITEDKKVPEIDGIVRGTGGAIIVAASTTMVGFAGLIITDYGGMQSLGLTMVLGIATCLVATVLVLPAAMLLLGEAR